MKEYIRVVISLKQDAASINKWQAGIISYINGDPDLRFYGQIIQLSAIIVTL